MCGYQETIKRDRHKVCPNRWFIGGMLSSTSKNVDIITSVLFAIRPLLSDREQKNQMLAEYWCNHQRSQDNLTMHDSCKHEWQAWLPMLL